MSKRIRRAGLVVSVAAGATLGGASAEAQTTVPAPGAAPVNAGPRSYTPADFARFAPRNALDMLRQVPGFTIREAVVERGLGQATGNVLLNGRRISGKSDDVAAQLGRIPAGNVVRIDIVDGATLEVPGLSGQVANVISRAGGVSSQFAWRPEFRANFTDPLLTRFEVSLSGTRGPVEYTIGLENQASHSGAGGPTLIYDAEGRQIEEREDIWTGEFQQPRVSGRFVIDGPGSSVGNLNLSYRRFWYDYREDGLRLGSPSLPDRERDVVIEENGYNYEIGGDYEFGWGPGRLKLIGLQRFSHIVPETTVVTSFADNRPFVGDIFTRTGDELERIARAEYRWRGGGSDWQISGEAAFNSFDNVAGRFTLRPSGEFVEVPFVSGSGRVEESRYEVIGSFGRALSPQLTLQVAAGGEYSQIAQIGANGLVREFVRPKGQISAAWTPDPRTTVNVRLQRRVGQLNFFDFLASVNLQDDRQNAGNISLVPPQSWEFEVEGVRQLGAWGTTTLRGYFHRIDDIIDIIPIGLTGESVGNVDRAVRYGVESRSTINFDPAGFRGARLDARFQLQGSALDDPLTGERRAISNSLFRLMELTFRHDVPNTDWAWGTGLTYSYYSQNVRLTEFGRQYEGPFWVSAYVEHKDVYGLTVRATMSNIFDARSRWDRTVFVNRRDGPISFIEDRDRLIGPIFSFQVRGRF